MQLVTQECVKLDLLKLPLIDITMKAAGVQSSFASGLLGTVGEDLQACLLCKQRTAVPILYAPGSKAHSAKWGLEGECVLEDANRLAPARKAFTMTPDYTHTHTHRYRYILSDIEFTKHLICFSKSCGHRTCILNSPQNAQLQKAEL